MNPIPFSWMLISWLALYGAGAFSGGVAVYKIWGYREMQAKIAWLKEDNRRFREALGFAEQLDDETNKVEVTNDDIMRAIVSKAPPPARKWFTRICPATVPAPDNFECVSAERMRDIERLQ